MDSRTWSGLPLISARIPVSQDQTEPVNRMSLTQSISCRCSPIIRSWKPRSGCGREPEIPRGWMICSFEVARYARIPSNFLITYQAHLRWGHETQSSSRARRRPRIEGQAAGNVVSGPPEPQFPAASSRKVSLVRNQVKLCAEMLNEQDISDDFGRPGRASSTFLRYEVEIGKKKEDSSATSPSIFDLELRSESLHHIRQGDANKKLRFPHSKSEFRDQAVKNRRFAKTGYISTEPSKDGVTEIIVHQDGGSRGPGQRAPARTAPRTIVGTTSTIATPTILAARREMQKWRLLSLEPSAMRRPDRIARDPVVVSDNGAHLAAALNRLKKLDGPDDDVAARISSRLAELVPVASVDVVLDSKRELLTLSVIEAGGQEFAASAISDGTLRFLAMSVLAEDPEVNGLICIEEPENGIHPERLPAMATLTRDLAVDVKNPLDSENIMRQVILATHSPYFLQLQNPDDVLLAMDTAMRHGDSPVRGLRCFPLKGSWRAMAEGYGSALGLTMMQAYLQPPEDAQLYLPFEPA